MASKSQLKKQKFLRENIIDQDLNPEKFINFLEGQKEDGQDIDNWTLKELKEQVELFKSEDLEEIDIKRRPTKQEELEVFGMSSEDESESESESESSSSSESEDDGDNAMEESKPKMKEVKPAKDKKEGGEKDKGLKKKDRRKYKARKNVEKFEPTVLVGKAKELTIEVSNPEVVKGGLFNGRSYTTYTLTTGPFNWSVKRRYSDFIWLHDCLIKRFPANYVRSFSRIPS